MTIKNWLTRLGIFAIVATFSGVALAQLFGNFPLVGGARYCITTVNGVCQQYVPAGPTSLTGDETLVADTNLSQGRMPQTVKLSLMSLNAAPITYSTVTAGEAFYAVTLDNNSGGVVFVASGTVSDARVTAPAAPIDGQQVLINSSHTLTAMQFIANTGQSLAATTPTALTASTTAPQGYKWVYRASNTTWYRLQ